MLNIDFTRFVETQTELTKQLVQIVLEEEVHLEDFYADEAVAMDKSIAETFGNTYPNFMLIQRPNESETQKKYRKDYFEATGNPVMGFLGHIEKQGDKVLKSYDCRIVFQENSRLPKKDTIQHYLTKDYYNGQNFFNTIANTIVSKILTAPNSILVIIPNEQEGDYARPYYTYIKPENTLFYKANEICIVKSELKCDVAWPGGQIDYGSGDIYYFFDRKNYLVAKHVGYEEGTNKKMWNLNTVKGEFRKHGHTSMPAMKVGRKLYEYTEDGHELRTSDLYDSLVFLRNAMMNYMDKIVEHNFHGSSIAWLLGIVDCNKCNGTGRIPDPNKGGKALECPSCNSTGKVQGLSGSGLETITIPVNTDAMGNTSKTPSSIGGFIERPETGARLFKEAFEDNIRWALKPFGLEHLMEVPLNQSGEAKSQDKEEGKSFVQSMSDHIGELLDLTVISMTNMRFVKLSREDLEHEMPVVLMPKSLNLSTAESSTAKLQNAETYGLPDYLKLSYSKDLIDKESGTNSDELAYFEARKRIDPMPASNLDTKMASRPILSDLKYILATNIDAIMIEAMEMNDGFLYLERAKQKEIAYSIAEKYLAEATNINLTTDVPSSKSSTQAPTT
jgi:hypothetical protein